MQMRRRPECEAKSIIPGNSLYAQGLARSDVNDTCIEPSSRAAAGRAVELEYAHNGAARGYCRCYYYVKTVGCAGSSRYYLGTYTGIPYVHWCLDAMSPAD